MAKRAGKAGKAGRFVTLKSDRVIFIPKGYKGKWADVRERIKGGAAPFEPDDPALFERDVKEFGRERAIKRVEMRRQRDKKMSEIRAREGRLAEKKPEAAEKKPERGVLAEFADRPEETKEIARALDEAARGYDFRWDGRLYRSETGRGGKKGDYYAIDPENAEMYADLAGGAPVRSFKFPNAKKPLIVDINKGTLAEVERFAGEKFADVGDVALLIEDALPGIKAAGYDSVVIIGETGPDIWGAPVEFVDLAGIVRRG